MGHLGPLGPLGHLGPLGSVGPVGYFPNCPKSLKSPKSPNCPKSPISSKLETNPILMIIRKREAIGANDASALCRQAQNIMSESRFSSV